MSTRWARKQLKRSQAREVWRLATFAIFGIAFGVATFLALEATDPNAPAQQTVHAQR